MSLRAMRSEEQTSELQSRLHLVCRLLLEKKEQNLRVFIQLAEGVDDATWLHHLHQGDYAHWFRTVIQDTGLAEETSEIGNLPDLSARARCTLVKTAIEKRYTAPA